MNKMFTPITDTELEDLLKQQKEFERLKEEYLKGNLSDVDILDGEEVERFLGRYSDCHTKWELFTKLVEQSKLTESAFNLGLKFAWILGNGTGTESLVYFQNANKELMMSAEELEFYRNLPDKVTIYRGCSMNEVEDEDSALGISWTTERKVAEFFAFRDVFVEEGEGEDLRAVYSATIDKSKIAAVFLDRDEYEIICIGVTDAELVTDYPTEYYSRYLQERYS